MDDDELISFFAGLFVGCFITGLISFCIISSNYQGSEQLAVSRGHAHYRISNPTNGETKFTWNPPCNKAN